MHSLFFFPLCTMSFTRFHTNYFINHKSNVISPLCHLILFLNNLITIWRNNLAPHALCIMLHARWTPAILQYCTTNTSTPGVAKRRHRLLLCLEHRLPTHVNMISMKMIQLYVHFVSLVKSTEVDQSKCTFRVCVKPLI